MIGKGGVGRGRASSETDRQLKSVMETVDIRVGMNPFDFLPNKTENDIQRASPDSGSSQNCYLLDRIW